MCAGQLTHMFERYRGVMHTATLHPLITCGTFKCVCFILAAAAALSHVSHLAAHYLTYDPAVLRAVFCMRSSYGLWDSDAKVDLCERRANIFITRVHNQDVPFRSHHVTLLRKKD